MSALIPNTLAVLVGIGISSGAVLAQSTASYSSVALTVPAATESVPAPYDASNVRMRLDKAHQLCEEGRWAEARREYASVAKLQRTHKVLADEALWNLANLYYGDRQIRRAAATMDELADAAQLHGNPVVQAKALIESAILYQSLKMPEQASARIERLQPLLDSPFLSAEVRSSIEKRISEE
ncbi:MAG: hypothetical protein H0W11_06540 [Gemmatimonadetes bacterium]|nr:hypothetical protein [Gemmatimonadota bacterium]